MRLFPKINNRALLLARQTNHDEVTKSTDEYIKHFRLHLSQFVSMNLQKLDRQISSMGWSEIFQQDNMMSHDDRDV